MIICPKSAQACRVSTAISQFSIEPLQSRIINIKRISYQPLQKWLESVLTSCGLLKPDGFTLYGLFFSHPLLKVSMFFVHITKAGPTRMISDIINNHELAFATSTLNRLQGKEENTLSTTYELLNFSKYFIYWEIWNWSPVWGLYLRTVYKWIMESFVNTRVKICFKKSSNTVLTSTS